MTMFQLEVSGVFLGTYLSKGYPLTLTDFENAVGGFLMGSWGCHLPSFGPARTELEEGAMILFQ